MLDTATLRRMPGTTCVYLLPDGTPLLLLLVRKLRGTTRQVKRFRTVAEAVAYARAALAGHWPARPIGTGDWHASTAPMGGSSADGVNDGLAA